MELNHKDIYEAVMQVLESMMTAQAASCGGDLYEETMGALEEFYGVTPNRAQFLQALRDTLTPEECALWLEFPKHTEPPVALEELKAKLGGRCPNFDALSRRLIETHFLDVWAEQDGRPLYVQNYIFHIFLAHAAADGNHPLAIAGRNWFNGMQMGASADLNFPHPGIRVVPHEGALIGGRELGVVSMDLEIPDTREVIPLDFVTHLIATRETFAVTHCICRGNKSALGERKCDHPTENCMIFDDVARRVIKNGGAREITREEALAIVLDSRNRGLVHCISNAEEPTVLCSCCSCCCLILNSLRRGERTVGKPSRYLIKTKPVKCIGCGRCTKVCPVKAIDGAGGKLTCSTDLCIGCGLCAASCPKGALALELRPDAQAYYPDAQHMDVLYI